MATYRNINVRSPFFTQLASTETNVDLELRIWTGDVSTDKPADPDYTLTKEVNGGFATFEVAELIRDYISHTSTLTTGKVWAEVALDDTVANSSTIYLASEGYRTYTDGLQNDTEATVADFVALPEVSGQKRIFVTESFSTVIPVYTQPQDALNWGYEKKDLSGTGTGVVTLSPDTQSDGQFVYITVDHNVSRVDFFFNGVQESVYVDALDCNKYNTATGEVYQKPVILQYVNKYGSHTRLPFSLKYVEQIKTSSDTFRRNTVDYGAMNASNDLHAKRKRITASKQSFTINTDWMDEYYVSQIEELLLSEYVWALVPTAHASDFQSVNITTSDLVRKNSLNDRLIQYTFAIETASDYINTVR